MKSTTASSLTGKFLLLIAMALLILNLHDISLFSPCQEQQAKIITALEILHSTPPQILQKLEKLKNAPLTQTATCKQLELFATELMTLKSCTSENQILNTLREITSKLDESEKSSSENSPNIIKELDQFRTDVLKKIAFDNEMDGLKKLQRDEEERILNEFIAFASPDLKQLQSTLTKLESIKFILYNSKLSLLDKIELDEMTEVLETNQGDVPSIFIPINTGTEKYEARIICSIESAAKLNPYTDIYVIFINLMSNVLYLNGNEALFSVVKRYPNIHLLAMENDKFIQYLSIDSMDKIGDEILSILPALLYAGIYLNPDVILGRNISGENKFVILDKEKERVSLDVFHVGKSSEVKDIVVEILNEGNIDFLTEFLKRYYKISSISELENKGVKVYPYKTFHPMSHYLQEDRKGIFDEKLQGNDDIFGFNIQEVRDKRVQMESKEILSLMGKRFCPRAYWSCKNEF